MMLPANRYTSDHTLLRAVAAASNYRRCALAYGVLRLPANRYVLDSTLSRSIICDTSQPAAAVWRSSPDHYTFDNTLRGACRGWP